VAGYIPPGEDKKKIIRDSRLHLWDDPYLYRVCTDGLLKICIPDFETWKILEHCHSSPYGGHYGAFHTNAKVWQSGFYCPTMYDDVKSFVQCCIQCQRHKNINTRNAMPLTSNHQIDIFDVWELISWAHSLTQKATNTSWLPSTMSLNGWKLFLVGLPILYTQRGCSMKSSS
jgi:hypothetical protein